MDRFSIVLADPDQLVRAGLKRVLAESTYDVVGEAPKLEDALVELGHRAVDLLLFDIDGTEESTAACLQAIRTRGIKTVVLTSNRSPAALETAVSWEVDAYLLKEISPEALHRSLQLVMLGQQILPGALMASLVAMKATEAEPVDRLDRLSPREKEILPYLVNGASNKTIARALGISEATVKVHLKTLRRKAGAANRTQVAVWAQRNTTAPQDSPSVAVVV